MYLPNLDQENISNRLYSYFPHSWFSEENKTLLAELQGAASVFLWLYQVDQYINTQMRLQTMTGDMLDLFAKDYFGNFLSRGAGESDNSFRTRIQAVLLTEKATRPAMENVLEYLTGYKPLIIEGGYSEGVWVWDYSAYDLGDVWGGGANELAYQCFITVYMVAGDGVKTPYSGYAFADGTGLGGYGQLSTECEAPFCYGDNIQSYLTTTFILNIINLFKPTGTVCWVRFESV
jgi:hypothetical protein